ncbi:hypothetical membrane protein [Thermoplasma acidophilum]|uniref:Hypothetical membrane protein n=1 Tax=Thermoplasma acidophilum (strain ATCC 25905 / DSM 1728 / JCM 9062 / NBRC 15155 / AMRC-C165) TaxID=273075 RepID=Q9HK69_THEAC|nr:hypothetical membrane protein [Thermoplasma acidophilum]
MISAFAQFYIVEFLITAIAGLTVSLIPYMTERSIVFGVRIPPGMLNSSRLTAMKRIYTLSVIAVTASAIIVSYALRFTVYPVIISTPTVIAVAFLIYLPMHLRVAAMKKELWPISGDRPVSAMVASGTLGSFPWLYSLPGLILIIAIFSVGIVYYPHIPAMFATHYGISGAPNQYSAKSPFTVFLLPVLSGIITVLLVVLAVAIWRTSFRLDYAVDDPVSRARIFRSRTVKFLLLVTAFINSTFMLSAFTEWGILKSYDITVVALPAILTAVAALALFAGTGQMGSRIHVRVDYKASDDVRHIGEMKDDDRYWKAGILYVNRNDGRILVPKRFGVGYTMNFGHPVSLVILGALLTVPVIVLVLIILKL